MCNCCLYRQKKGSRYLKHGGGARLIKQCNTTHAKNAILEKNMFPNMLFIYFGSSENIQSRSLVNLMLDTKLTCFRGKILQRLRYLFSYVNYFHSVLNQLI